MAYFTGTSGDDKLIGGSDDDTFFIDQGGKDVVRAGAGSDLIEAGGAFTSADRIDGGDGADVLQLDGDYSSGVNINPTDLHGVEQITLEDGGSYNLTFADGDYGLDMGSPLLSILASYYGADSPMNIDASAVTTTQFYIYAGTADDSLRGGAMGDSFYLIGGGNDSVDGGGGDDYIHAHGGSPGDMSLSGGDGNDDFEMEYTFNLNDTIDGGSGTDALFMEIGGTPQMTLSNAVISQVEQIYLTGSGPIDIRLADDLADDRLATGFLLVSADQSTDTVHIDGGRERDTSLHLTGGSGDDWLKGGAMDDVIDLTAQFNSGYGHDTALGGKGADTFVVEDGGMNAEVSIDGGAGFDTLQILQRNFIDVVDVSGVRNVEVITLDGTTNLVLGDGNVAKGHVLEITATDAVGDSSPINVDGTAETNGRLSITGGQAWDSLVGGDGADTLTGGLGGDTLVGGLGADHFVYTTVDDSQAGGSDLIYGLGKKDVIDLHAIDADINTSGDQAFKLVDHFSGKAGEAVVSYDAGQNLTLVSLDVDGDGVADSVIGIDGNHHSFHNFVL